MLKQKAIPKQIERVTKQIVDNFHPRKVILFGSYAYGNPGKDSDADFMVVMNTRKKTLEVAASISATVDHLLPLDILVRTPGQIKKRVKMGDFFLKEVLEKGIVLYEAGNQRVG